MNDIGLQRVTDYFYKRPGQLHITAKDVQGRPEITAGDVIDKEGLYKINI